MLDALDAITLDASSPADWQGTLIPTMQSGFAVVRKLGLALPNVEEGTAYGSPALKVGGKMFACLAVNKSAEPNTLVVCVAVDQRDELIAEQPRIYYLTDHYVNHPCVLVRLARIREDALRDLLLMGWQFMSSTQRRRVRKRTRKRRALPR